MKKILSYLVTSMVALASVGAGALPVFAADSYTAAQVAPHNLISDCWLIISGNVYNVTSFIPIHPGGNAIVPYCGTDATSIFDAIHNPSAFALLPTYLIGAVVPDLTAPANVTGSGTDTTVILTWNVSTGGASPITYTILRNGTSVGTTQTNNFTDTGLTSSTAYSYVIQATDSATPTANTASSAAVSVSTTVGTTLPLNAPTNVTGTPSQTSVNLSWNVSTGGLAPMTYTIMRNGVSVGTTTSTSFTDTGLTASTVYSYVIQVTDSATPTANTASSAAVSVTTLALTAPLTPPTGIVVGAYSVTLNWTAATGGVMPITYSIIRNGVTVGTTTTTSFMDTGLNPSTAYSYVIMATDSATPTPNTASSAAFSLTTLGAPGSDTTPPVVSITSPADQSTASGTLTVLVNATDNVGVTKVVLFSNGKKIATSTSSPFSFILDTKKLADGTYSLVAKAYDAAGNVGTSVLVKIVVKNNHNTQNGDGDDNGKGDGSGNKNGNGGSDGNGNNNNGNNGNHGNGNGNGNNNSNGNQNGHQSGSGNNNGSHGGNRSGNSRDN